MIKQGNLPPEDYEALELLRKQVYFRSGLIFLEGHVGYRPQSLHTFLGNSGAGKSTLVRTLVIDLLEASRPTDKIFVYLSEETTNEFLAQMHRSGWTGNLDRLFVLSEIDIFTEKMTKKELKKKMLDALDQCGATIMLYDNITTSQLYFDLPPEGQSRTALGLSALAKSKNIPIIIISHTDGKITENHPRIIDQNDIRGNKSIVNLSHFFYIMQRFDMGEGHYYQTIRITKHRGQDCEHKLFGMRYHKARAIYYDFKKLSFNDFKQAYKTRVTL